MNGIEIYLLCVIPPLLLGLYAQFKLNSTYKRYIQVPVGTGISGAQAAREILDAAGLQDMPIQEVPGHLSDHYDPIKKQLCLSSENYRGRSLAAVGVAAHEAGHALQHKASYAWLNLRMAMVPLTSIASSGAMVLFFLGFFLSLAKLAIIGIVIYSVIFAFQLITLPVEYDASRRAKVELARLGIVHPGEAAGVASVLNAAALTYVAAMVQSLMTLLHFILLARSSDR
ncbi:MAG TPA: zinc metallopeptidase [Verrucomicrobiae bacterium]